MKQDQMSSKGYDRAIKGGHREGVTHVMTRKQSGAPGLFLTAGNRTLEGGFVEKGWGTFSIKLFSYGGHETISTS